MATHDYYNASYPHDTTANPYFDTDYDRSNSQLPPTTSTRRSPFEDAKYPYARPAPSQSYLSSSGRSGNDADPFDDENSIPLSGRKSKHASTTTVAPMLPHEMDDPFVRDADPRKTRRPKSKDGWFSGKITWVVFVLTTIQLIVFLAEIIKNGVLTGSPIEIHPSFNPMIGPSPYVMINMGSRFDPCMHNMPGIQDRPASEGPIDWPCPNATSITPGSDGVSCSLHELCGFGATTDNPAPDQWWRFIIPMFIHAGFVHIGFNLLLQLTLGRDVERLIGSVRFAIVYFAAGIFGFVLGGNFAADGISSCGCSGSLFGILAITLIDLLYTWKQRPSPLRDLAFIGLDIIIAFVLGLLPGLDNFSHIGGFLMGLVLGVCILRSPAAFSRRAPNTTANNLRYSGVSVTPSTRDREAGLLGFVRAPGNFFQNRRGVWWVWWFVRVVMLIGALVAFILLLKNFYVWGTTCHWCRYLSCLPITVDGTNWCKIGNLDFQPNNSTSSSNSRRELFEFAGSTAFHLSRNF